MVKKEMNQVDEMESWYIAAALFHMTVLILPESREGKKLG